jgi:hypothetical protein
MLSAVAKSQFQRRTCGGGATHVPCAFWPMRDSAPSGAAPSFRLFQTRLLPRVVAIETGQSFLFLRKREREIGSNSETFSHANKITLKHFNWLINNYGQVSYKIPTKQYVCVQLSYRLASLISENFYFYPIYNIISVKYDKRYHQLGNIFEKTQVYF